MMMMFLLRSTEKVGYNTKISVEKNNGIGLFKTVLTKYLSVLLFYYTNFQSCTAFAKKRKRGKGNNFAPLEKVD